MYTGSVIALLSCAAAPPLVVRRGACVYCSPPVAPSPAPSPILGEGEIYRGGLRLKAGLGRPLVGCTTMRRCAEATATPTARGRGAFSWPWNGHLQSPAPVAAPVASHPARLGSV